MLSAITWDVSPDLFTIRAFGAEIPIAWYGLMFAMSFFLGQLLGAYLFRKDGKPSGDVELLTIYVVLGTVIGARLGHYLFYEWELLFRDPLDWLTSLVTPPFRGLASHGATLAIPAALYLYARRKPDQPLLWVTDRVVTVVALAGILIRLGNLFNSEIYGTPTSLPWGFRFVRETDPSLLPVVPRHPTQLYEALFCLFLLVLTLGLWRYKRQSLPIGILTGLFITLLFSFRFLVEFLKNDQSAFEQGMALNMGQILSIPAVLAGLVILWYARRNAYRLRPAAEG
ncbi:MAG: prolipoprotein diacylglyceryl transferase [Cytophagales bacterium]|nr:prolipoprotein diacylglyceryl transferase [Cytophagales bacterium]